MNNTKRIWLAIGPGLLFAAAAIGVSHLVQSTRAGALYGLYFIPVILVTNFLKWPFFEAGPRYSQATGKSLIFAYTQLYKWALPVIALITITSMFIVQATVTMVTAGLLQHLIPFSIPEGVVIGGLLAISVGILWIGKFQMLDKVIRYIVIILALATIAAVISGLSLPIPAFDFLVFDWQLAGDIAFMVALLGWMPAPIDISIWHSTWTLAKQKVAGKVYQPWDFRVGYWGTTILAVLFLMLGAIFLFTNTSDIPSSGVAFAGRLMQVYEASLGQSYWLVLISAITCMFSTTLAVLDAYPRVCMYLQANSGKTTEERPLKKKYYRPLVLLVAAMAWIITQWFSGQMIALVQLATTIAFLSAPVIAFLNMRAMGLLPKAHQPKKLNRITALLGLIFLTAFSVYYLLWYVGPLLGTMMNG